MPDDGDAREEEAHTTALDDLLDQVMPDNSLPAPGQPMAVARALIADRFNLDDVLLLRHWRGAWWQWEQSRWAEIDDRVARKAAYEFTETAIYLEKKGETWVSKPWAPNRHKVSDLIDAFSAIAHLDERVTTPAWTTPEPWPATEMVACRNGLLHLPTRLLTAHTPTFFNQVSVAIDYDEDAPEPTRWLAFLESLWRDDHESIELLQEWFGYIISGDLSLQKILLIIGPLRGGKGTIARTLQALVGKGNYCGPTLNSLCTNFGLQTLIGKPLATFSDVRVGRANLNVVIERLLSISGEDTIDVDVKYKEPWTGKLPTRLVILSNELPQFGDASGAIASRFLVLSLTKSWLGHEDRGLESGILAELPSILNWSLDGLERLQERGRFYEPTSSQDSVGALADLVSPTSAFIRERGVVAEADGTAPAVPIDDAYQAWRTWAEDAGHKRTSVQTFGRDLRAALGGRLKITQPVVNGKQVRHYQGFRLRTSADDDHIAFGPTEDHSAESRAFPRLSEGPPTRDKRVQARENQLSAQVDPELGQASDGSTCEICVKPARTYVNHDLCDEHREAFP
jgi:putative DNA primase/helicase